PASRAGSVQRPLDRESSRRARPLTTKASAPVVYLGQPIRSAYVLHRAGRTRQRHQPGSRSGGAGACRGLPADALTPRSRWTASGSPGRESGADGRATRPSGSASERSAMSDIILHHYWESPYAEKIRLILGFKRLAWRSVIIPMIMPKPDLTALTGGYRKTPVLQLGAEIYCDTDLITRTIERLQPEPTLFPDGNAALSYMLGAWQ